jgi:hypothetical protein
VYGLENAVDVLSSVVVAWRYWAPGKITPEREELLKKREVRASTAISYILILLGIFVIGSASADLSRGYPDVEQEEMKAVFIISFFSFITFTVLTVFKFHYARVLDSDSLYKDGLCSLIGTVLSGALFVNTFIIRSKPSLWWVDPFVALFCGMAALFFGVQSLWVLWRTKGVPIFSLTWLFTSRGDDDKEGSSTMHSSEGNPGNNPELELQGNDKTRFSEVV